MAHGRFVRYPFHVRADVIRWAAKEPPVEADLRRRLEREGCGVFGWSDSPGAHYDAHAHDHDESIWVVRGQITFGIAGRALLLRAGDRLMLPAGTIHTADAGPCGATYLIGEHELS